MVETRGTTNEVTCGRALIATCRTKLGMTSCEVCPRYADILRCVQQIYGDSRWAVTPEGLLQEIA